MKSVTLVFVTFYMNNYFIDIIFVINASNSFRKHAQFIIENGKQTLEM